MTKKAKRENFVCLQTTITRSSTHASSNGGRTSRKKSFIQLSQLHYIYKKNLDKYIMMI